jgi:hypothetical protein
MAERAVRVVHHANVNVTAASATTHAAVDVRSFLTDLTSAVAGAR